MKTKGYRRESVLSSSPNPGPKRTPELPGSAEGRSVFPCRECERYQPRPGALTPPWGGPPCSDPRPLAPPQGVRQD